MNWEWRIFYDVHLNPWKTGRKETEEIISKLKAADLDMRPDYYYDLGEPDSGLKERWEMKPLLELKVRQKLDGQLESWEKCMATEIDMDKAKGLDINTIKQCLNREISNTDAKKPKSIASLNKMQRIVDQLKTTSLPRIEISKKRKQIRGLFREQSGHWEYFFCKIDDPNAIIVERSEITVSKSSLPTKTRLSICIEGKNPAYIKQFVNEFIEVGDGKIMGYPEFVIHYLKSDIS